ncbi:hypothetical protein QFZ30_003075 [Arthrobacter pascens]|uniref:hypothetical protein n=1 Tax=Arthrobacter pascens TaxID=1677 RepID=UPI00278E86EA|nr:hypothetical protein [Arthrobacter pascens]MDQ0679693.1 hypothetical protein [Arthrobacter pascens]
MSPRSWFSKLSRDDVSVYLYYSIPRLILNVLVVGSLTALASIWLFEPYISVTKDKIVLAIALGSIAAICSIARRNISGQLEDGPMKNAALVHFDQSVTGHPSDKFARSRTQVDSSVKAEHLGLPEIMELAKWATADDVQRASGYVLSFLEVVVRARDKYTLTPPTIGVETLETRRVPRSSLPAEDDVESDADPRPGQKNDIIPLGWIEKGFLLNEFSATIDDDNVDLLGSKEAHAVSLLTVDSLMLQVLGEHHDLLQRQVREVILSDRQLPDKKVKKLLHQIKGRCVSDQDSEQQKLLVYLCQLILQLSKQQLIYGVTKDLKRGTFITVGRCWSIKRRLVSGGVHRPGHAAEQLRAILGLAPRLFFVRMLSVTRAHSYHLEAVIPEGMYYYKGMAVVDGKQLPSSNASTDGRGVAFPHSSSIGTTLVHETYRDIKSSRSMAESSGATEEPDPVAYFALHVRETPPGAGLALLMGSLATGFLVFYVTGFYQAHQAEGSIPAILASLPAILAGWMVSRLSADSLARMSLATAGNIAWYIVNSLFAALLPSALVDARNRSEQFDFLELHSDSILIGLLCLSVSASFFSIGWHFLLRSWRYNDRLAAW